MIRKYCYCSFFVFYVLLFISYVFAYDDQSTHPALTEKAITMQFDQYMKDSLGFQSGIQTELSSGNIKLSILRWLTKGSTDEDSPACRASNHFHDPLKTWDQSKMSDDLIGAALGIRLECDREGWTYSNRQSNITWATGYLSPSPGGQKQTFSSNPDYAPINWDAARDYFYLALTATAKEDREANFTSTFKTVGHVLHLLEDMAVPAHVRNDFTSHVAFNKITSDNFVKWFGNHFEYYVQNHTEIISNISDLDNNYPSFTNTRLTDFWDTDQYTGDNPSSGLNIGLAEFTNANYLSDSTIPYTLRMPYHMYTYPKIDDPNKLQICSDYEPGSLDKRVYLSRIDRGPCPLITEARSVDHFAALGFWNDFSVNTIIDSFLHNDPTMLATPISLDDNVHNTYATELLPRAVGYSAGLLDYFFRGDIEAIDAMPIISSNGDTSHVTLKVKNNTPNETLGPGEGEEAELIVSYKYGLPGNEVYGVSNSVPFNEEIASGSESINVYTFNFPDPIPSDAEAVTLTLVYRGKLGNEENAVAASAVKKGTYVVLETTSPWTYAVFKLSIINENGYSYKLTPVEANCTPANGETVCKTVDGGVNQNIYAVDDIGIENWDITSYSSINDFNETYDNNLACNDHPYGYTTNVNNIYDFEKSGIELEPFYSGEESIQNEIDKESFYTSFDDDSVIAIPYGIRVKRGETNSVGSFSIDQYGYPILSPYLVYQGKENEYGDFFSYYKWSHNKIKTFKDYHCPDPPNKAEISAMYNEIYNVVSVFIIFKVGDIRQRIQIGDMTSYEKCHWNGSICSRDIYTRDGIWETVSDFSFSDYNIVYAGNRYDINGENMDMSSVVFGLINTDRDSSMPLGYWQEWEINDANAEVFLGNWYGSFSYDGNFKRIGIYSVK